jgi:hypothetical protein
VPNSLPPVLIVVLPDFAFLSRSARSVASANLLNKPYDAFADEGDVEEEVEEAKKPKTGPFKVLITLKVL